MPTAAACVNVSGPQLTASLHCALVIWLPLIWALAPIATRITVWLRFGDDEPVSVLFVIVAVVPVLSTVTARDRKFVITTLLTVSVPVSLRGAMLAPTSTAVPTMHFVVGAGLFSRMSSTDESCRLSVAPPRT